MKPLLCLLLILCSNFGFGQRSSSVVKCRIPLKEAIRAQLYSEELELDLLQKVGELSILNEINIYVDSTLLSNPISFIELPITKIVPNRDTTDFHVIDVRQNYFTLFESNGIAKDMDGNPVIMIRDGQEMYVHNPPTKKAVSALNIFEIEVAYSVNFNKRTKTYNYSPKALGFGIVGKDQTVWIKLTEFKKAVEAWKSYPIFTSLETNHYLSFQYVQDGLCELPENEELLYRKIEIKNTEENANWFPSNERSNSFIDEVFSIMGEKGVLGNLCYFNSLWYQRYFEWKEKNYFLDSSLANTPNIYEIPIEKGAHFRSKDTLYSASGEIILLNKVKVDSLEMYYVNVTDITALHILEYNVKDSNDVRLGMKPIEVAFVIRFEGKEEEVFHVNIEKLINSATTDAQKVWIDRIMKSAYEGRQYWQQSLKTNIRWN